MSSSPRRFGLTSTPAKASPTPTPPQLTGRSFVSAMQHIYLDPSLSHRVRAYIRIGRWSKLLNLWSGCPVPKGYTCFARSWAFTSTPLALVIYRRYFAPPEPTTANAASSLSDVET